MDALRYALTSIVKDTNGGEINQRQQEVFSNRRYNQQYNSTK
jgi:hypothetical protein